MLAVLIYSTLILLVFILSDVLYHKVKMQVDHTRKFAHVLSGLITMTFPLFIDALWQISLMTVLFLGLLYTSENKKWFQGITGVERKTKGSWLFVISIWICFTASLKFGDLFFTLPIAVLTFADTMAYFVGKAFPLKSYSIFNGKKSIGGSLAFFCTAVVVFIIYQYLTQSAFTLSILIFIFIASILATLAEAVSSRGWDNFTVPIVTLAVLFFYIIYNVIFTFI